MKSKLFKTLFVVVVGVGCFVGGMYYATKKFNEGLDRVMDEYEVISDKVDTFTKVSDPKTIRLYVRELNKILDDVTLLSVGFGIYNGLILVFLKSSPTIDVPLVTTIPP